MSRLDWVVECNKRNLSTCEIVCLIFHHAYEEGGYNDPLHIWLNEIKPKVGKVRLRKVREAFERRVWEDLC